MLRYTVLCIGLFFCACAKMPNTPAVTDEPAQRTIIEKHPYSIEEVITNIQLGNVESVKEFLKYGSNVNESITLNMDGHKISMNPLTTAIIFKQPEIVKLFAKNPAVDLNKVFSFRLRSTLIPDGEITPLVLSLIMIKQSKTTGQENQAKQTFQYLANSSRINVNAKMNNKITSLHISVFHQLADETSTLLDRGADMFSSLEDSTQQKTADKKPSLKFLINKKNTPFQISTILENKEIFILFVNKIMETFPEEEIKNLDTTYYIASLSGILMPRILKQRLKFASWQNGRTDWI